MGILCCREESVAWGNAIPFRPHACEGSSAPLATAIAIYLAYYHCSDFYNALLLCALGCQLLHWHEYLAWAKYTLTTIGDPYILLMY